MGLFPHLEIEAALQINDRTRLSGVKSFVSTGTTPIAAMTLAPGRGATPISIYNATDSNRYTDWEFTTWNHDISGSLNKIDFQEGGSTLVATLSDGTYTLAQLAAEIETQLNAAGVNTYTVTVGAKDKLTIEADGGFSLLAQTGDNREQSILPLIGFPRDINLTSTIEGRRVEYLNKAITLSMNNGGADVTQTEFLKLYSVEGDALFSDDSDLTAHEADILNWVIPGRNSFKNVHRKSQSLIIDWLNQKGFVDVFQDKFDKAAFLDVEEFRTWSMYMTLRLIFSSISNEKDDRFADRAKEYKGWEVSSRERAIIRVDIDKDGKLEPNEGLRISTGNLFVR